MESTQHEIPQPYLSFALLLPRGDDNPMPAKELARYMQVDERTILEYANTLSVKYGIPVLASREYHRHGLYIPMTEEERNHGLVPLKNQVNAMQARIEAVAQADLSRIEALD